MREYFISVFTLSLFFGLAEMLSYRGRAAVAERGALALMLIFTVASPLPKLFSEGIALPSLPEYGENGGSGEFEEVTAEAVEQGLCRQIAERFSLKEEWIGVRCFGFVFEEMRAERIRVTLSISAARVDPEEIEEYVNGLGMGECEVVYEIG